MPPAAFLSPKSVSPRLAWRTLRDAHTKRLRTQIFVIRAFTEHACPKFSSRKIKKNSQAAAGSPSPKGRTSWWRSPRLAPQSHALHASAKSTNSYAHGAAALLVSRPNIPPAPAPEPPPVTRPLATFPRCSEHSSFFSSLPANCSLSTSSALSHSNTALPAVGAPRWPEDSAWVARRPEREGARTHGAP